MNRKKAFVCLQIILLVFLAAGCKKSTKTSSTEVSNGSVTTLSADCPAADGSAPRKTSFSKAPPMCIDTSKTYIVNMQTDAGNMTIKLDPAKAPKTVNNFVVLTRYHFYDGLTFHRVLKDFVIQGGDPVGDGSGGPGYEFADELPKSVNEYQEGSLAMANSGKNTNGSQFFIVLSANGAQALSRPAYSLFGQVTDGLDVMHKIEADGSEDDSSGPAVVHKMTQVTVTEQ